MLTVAIVCGAGASSTFLARRLSDIAAASGHDFRFVPSPLDSVAPDTADLVALTAHVVSDDSMAHLTAQAIDFIVLPSTVRGGFGADDALAAITAHFDNNGRESDDALSSAESKEL